MSPRVFKPRQRKGKNRDAKLIIIASEGTETEPKYFSELAVHENFRNPKVHVVPLKRESTNSSPQHVIKDLDEFKREYSLNKFDELWLVIDIDRWPPQELSDVAAKCYQKNYLLAVSNPCFELWLLLHVKSLDSCTQDEMIDLLENKKASLNGPTHLEQQLRSVVGSYTKKLSDTSPYIPHAPIAIERAKKLDTRPEDRWPNELGTRVYRLVKSIINSSQR